VLDRVSSRLGDYMVRTNVQPLQSSYPLALEAAARLSEARGRLAHWLNARGPEELVLGSSTTLLLYLLSLVWKDAETRRRDRCHKLRS
jgi:selenocysteine lyase/cysteine desulfurase